MRSMYAVLLVIVMVLSFNTGCATIKDGATQYVRAKSIPSGAAIRVDGKDTDLKTPNVLELERSQRHHIEFVLNGYKTLEVGTTRTFNWWATPDVLTYGLAFIPDFILGGIYNVHPGEITVTLEKIPDAIKVKPVKKVQAKVPAVKVTPGAQTVSTPTIPAPKQKVVVKKPPQKAKVQSPPPESVKEPTKEVVPTVSIIGPMPMLPEPPQQTIRLNIPGIYIPELR